MKTLIGLIIFEVFAFFAVLFYFEAKKTEVPPYEAEVEHIEHVNDSIADKLNSNIARLDSLLDKSKAMRTQIEVLTNKNR